MTEIVLQQLRKGRLVANHIAYLRGVAQGLSRDAMARLYLGVTHGGRS